MAAIERLAGLTVSEKGWREKVFASDTIIPEILTQELERIATTYQEMEFHKHSMLQVSKGTLKDMIMDLSAPQPERFKGRFDIPVVTFGQIPAADQASLAGINYHLKGYNACDWEEDPREYRTPKRVHMAWMQDGWENLNKSVETVRSTFALDERGGTEYNGIGLYVARPNILKDHRVDLPGTSVGPSRAAYLELKDGKPRLLCYYFALDGHPMFGSATCGRNKS